MKLEEAIINSVDIFCENIKEHKKVERILVSNGIKGISIEDNDLHFGLFNDRTYTSLPGWIGWEEGNHIKASEFIASNTPPCPTN